MKNRVGVMLEKKNFEIKLYNKGYISIMYGEVRERGAKKNFKKLLTA